MGDFSIPPLNQFLFDRVWFKAYPWPFKCRYIDPLCREKIREWLEQGVFQAWSMYGWRMYRTLNCVKLAKKRWAKEGRSVMDLRPKHCGEVLERSSEEHRGDVWPFEVLSEAGDVAVDVSGEVYTFEARVVDSVYFRRFLRVVKGVPREDKFWGLEYKPWLKISVRPHMFGLEPPLLRVFYNVIERVREEFKIELPTEGWYYSHGNWIPLEAVTEAVIRRNHELAFDPWIREFIREEWRKVFLEDIELAMRVSQVEIARDMPISKDVLLLALHGVGGPVRTLKADNRGLREVEYHDTDIGVKYYITVKKGLQVKVYTKAVSQRLSLNRLEYTVTVNGDFGLVKPEDVFNRVGEVHLQVAKGLAGGVQGVIKQIREMLKDVVRCRRNCDAHYAFVFDLLLLGCIKGTRAYSEISRLYKQRGFVLTKGRGRNAMTCINESYIAFDVRGVREKIVELLGVAGIKPLILPRLEIKPEEEELEESEEEEEGVKTEKVKARDVLDEI